MAEHYDPIDCSLHDRLESVATLHKSVDLVYFDDAGGRQSVQDVIVDVYARDGVEYLTTRSGATVRLDRVESVDDVRFMA